MFKRRVVEEEVGQEIKKRWSRSAGVAWGAESQRHGGEREEEVVSLVRCGRAL